MKLPIISALVLGILFTSCNKTDSNDPKNENPESLFLSFKTPDWDAHINCDHLVLDATNSSVLSATSESTKETFYLNVPQDSSSMSLSSNIKKYGISASDLFTFNQTLPITKGNSIRLVGIQGMNDNSYNEIVSIKYDHSDASGTYFKLKGSYKMKMKPMFSTTNDTIKEVYGNYHFLIKTVRK